MMAILLLALAAAGAAAAEWDPGTVPGGIPRIIHQNYMKPEALLEEVQQEKFHLSWARSVKAHHPGWKYILWDLAACERLLEDRYPWFLPLFRKHDSLVLRSDAMRVFILHAFGGVYLDMDTEVYGDMEPSLVGHSLVVSGEGEGGMNNAQMASAPGHPFWERMMQQVTKAFNKTYGHKKHKYSNDDILNASGPWAMGAILQGYLRQYGYDATKLNGTYVDYGWHQRLATRNGSTTDMEAYSTMDPVTIAVRPRGTWFTPCNWNNGQCLNEASSCAQVIRTLLLCEWHKTHWVRSSWNQCLSEHELTISQIKHVCDWKAGHRSTEGLSPHVTMCLTRFGALYGQHHFSGSWLPSVGITINPNLGHRVNHVARHMVEFFNHPGVFLEANAFCAKPRDDATSGRLPEDRTQHWAVWLSHALQPLQLSMANGQDSANSTEWAAQQCRWVSVFQRQCVQGYTTCCLPDSHMDERIRELGELVRQGNQANCTVDVLTDMDTETLKSNLSSLANRTRITHTQFVLGHPADKMQPKDTGLTAMLKRTGHAEQRLDLLHVSVPGACGWRAVGMLNHELDNALETARPTTLILQIGTLRNNEAHLAYEAYQQLLQSRDYLGQAYHKYHASGHDKQGSDEGQSGQRNAAQCADCEARAGDTALPPLWLGLVRKPLLLRNLFQHRKPLQQKAA